MNKKLTIIKVGEEKVIPSGKKLKELEINKEGLDWNFNRVAMWEDYAGYDVVKEGMVLENSHIQEKDQDTINPNTGKPYKNYTLRQGAAPAYSNSNGASDAKQNAIYELLKRVAEKVGVGTQAESEVEKIHSQVAEEEINPDDIPF